MESKELFDIFKMFIALKRQCDHCQPAIKMTLKNYTAIHVIKVQDSKNNREYIQQTDENKSPTTQIPG